MPFGLGNPPSTFECLMDAFLGGLLGDVCLVYLDDIIVYGHTFCLCQDRLESDEAEGQGYMSSLASANYSGRGPLSSSTREGESQQIRNRLWQWRDGDSAVEILLLLLHLQTGFCINLPPPYLADRKRNEICMVRGMSGSI